MKPITDPIIAQAIREAEAEIRLLQGRLEATKMVLDRQQDRLREVLETHDRLLGHWWSRVGRFVHALEDCDVQAPTQVQATQHRLSGRDPAR